jgi:hypothetical protein
MYCSRRVLDVKECCFCFLLFWVISFYLKGKILRVVDGCDGRVVLCRFFTFLFVTTMGFSWLYFFDCGPDVGMCVGRMGLICA